MAKFTKLNIGDSVASSGGRVWKKLSAESGVDVSAIVGTWKWNDTVDLSMIENGEPLIYSNTPITDTIGQFTNENNVKYQFSCDQLWDTDGAYYGCRGLINDYGINLWFYRSSTSSGVNFNGYSLSNNTIEIYPAILSCNVSEKFVACLKANATKPTYALYNGVRLPTIPNLADYPYCWIRNNTTTGYYDLIMATGNWFLSSTDTLNHNDSNACKWYRVEIATAESATAWTYNSDTTSSGWGCESGRDLVWSNHDIPNGSATATDIYFEGTEPVPTV